MATRKRIRERPRHDRGQGLDKHTRRLLERGVVALEAIADAVGVDTTALESRLGGLEKATADLKDTVQKNKPQG